MAAFIAFSNKVEGPCQKHDHVGWIELDSWNWSCAREMSGGNQVGWASGVAKFEVLEFTAPVGSATIAMFMKMLNGTHFETVTVHCTKNTGKTNQRSGWTCDWNMCWSLRSARTFPKRKQTTPSR